MQAHVRHVKPAMALNDTVSFLLGDTSSCHLPAKQSVEVISKRFIGKIYCPSWLANVPRSHSVIRSVGEVMCDGHGEHHGPW